MNNSMQPGSTFDDAAEAKDGAINYKCPNCGAPLAFNIEKQNWSCDFCLSEFSEKQMRGMGQDASEKTDERGRDYTHKSYHTEAWRVPQGERFDNDTQAYSCPSCGGKIITDRNTVATFCPYCRNPAVMASRLEDERRPSRLVPFKLDKQHVIAAMKNAVRRKPLLPSAFRRQIDRGEVTGLYAPYWLFGAQAKGFISGRGTRIHVWRDSKYEYTKTDTYLVERGGDMVYDDIPVDGSTRLDDGLMRALEPFDMHEMRDFLTSFLSGHFAEDYDVDAASAADTAFERMENYTEQTLRGMVSGYSGFTIENSICRRSGENCSYVMLPVWLYTSRFNGKTYTYAMNGQTGKLSGRLPVSAARAAVWFTGLFAAISGLSLLVGGWLY